MKSVIVAGVLGLATLGTVAPASAAYDDCNNGRVCLWGLNDYKWMLIEKPGGQGVTNLTGDVNNENDSWGNRSTYFAGAFDGHDKAGECTELPEFDKDPNIPWYDADDWSSLRTQNGCNP